MRNTPHNLQHLCLSSIHTLPMKKLSTTDILTVSMPLSSSHSSLFTFFKNPFFFVKNPEAGRRQGQQGYKGPKPLSNLIFCCHKKTKKRFKREALHEALHAHLPVFALFSLPAFSLHHNTSRWGFRVEKPHCSCRRLHQ